MVMRFFMISTLAALALNGCGNDSQVAVSGLDGAESPKLILKFNSKFNWIYEGEILSLKADLLNSVGNIEDVTNSVEWSITPSNKLDNNSYGYFMGKEFGTVQVTAYLNHNGLTIRSAPINIDIIRFPLPCELADDPICLPVTELDSGGVKILYTHTPSLDFVNSLAFTQSLSASGKHYFYTKSEGGDQYPLFSIKNTQNEADGAQFDAFCNFLNELEFAGIHSWTIPSLDMMKVFSDQVSINPYIKIPTTKPYLVKDFSRFSALNLDTGSVLDLPLGTHASYISCVAIR
ncbi:hypothetical protein BVJ60_16075 [Vibrio cholerae]|uniref:hypothetical protein n=1 Tax=Vibrio cholerae TaxID=666 RepID=UPI00096B8A0A|nr:hypothetical protein [Vibrio cholerae]MBO1386283.1 hypothetical protein [Vibrio cholerae]WOQ88813.1 hypothetical protein R4535_06830 [Vibrio cholerae]